MLRDLLKVKNFVSNEARIQGAKWGDQDWEFRQGDKDVDYSMM